MILHAFCHWLCTLEVSSGQSSSRGGGPGGGLSGVNVTVMCECNRLLFVPAVLICCRAAAVWSPGCGKTHVVAAAVAGTGARLISVKAGPGGPAGEGGGRARVSHWLQLAVTCRWAQQQCQCLPCLTLLFAALQGLMPRNDITKGVLVCEGLHGECWGTCLSSLPACLRIPPPSLPAASVTQ